MCQTFGPLHEPLNRKAAGYAALNADPDFQQDSEHLFRSLDGIGAGLPSGCCEFRSLLLHSVEWGELESAANNARAAAAVCSSRRGLPGSRAGSGGQREIKLSAHYRRAPGNRCQHHRDCSVLPATDAHRRRGAGHRPSGASRVIRGVAWVLQQADHGYEIACTSDRRRTSRPPSTACQWPRRGSRADPCPHPAQG